MVEFFVDNLKLFICWPGKNALFVPYKHVVPQIVSSLPPSFIRDVIFARVNMKHLDQVLLGIEPGLLDDHMVNLTFDLAIFHVVGVHEIQCDTDKDSFQSARKSNSNPGGRDLNTSSDAPENTKEGPSVENDNRAGIGLDVVFLWVVFIDWENPGRMIDRSICHMCPVLDPRGQELDSQEHQYNHDDDRDAGKL